MRPNAISSIFQELSLPFNAVIPHDVNIPKAIIVTISDNIYEFQVKLTPMPANLPTSISFLPVLFRHQMSRPKQ